MTYIEEILINYDDSFVEDYDKWKEVIDNVNGYIPMYLETINMEGSTVDNFSYDEFCKEFKKEVENYLMENQYLTSESVHTVLDVMVKNRILYALSLDDYLNMKNLFD